jgi:hypothetical protein
MVKYIKSTKSNNSSIEYAQTDYTGGGIFLFTGKMSNTSAYAGNWFIADDDNFDIRILNEDPLANADVSDDWTYADWQEERLVKDLDGKERNYAIAYNASLTATNPEGFGVIKLEYGSASTKDYAVFGGGEDFAGYRKTAVEGYNASLTRTYLNDLSVARTRLGGGAIGEYVLFAGGRDESGADSTAVEAFNASFTRTTITSLSAAIPAGLRNGVSTKKHVLFGSGRGTSNKYVNSVVNAYDASLTRYVPAGLSFPIYGNTGVGSDDYVIFCGGCSNEAFYYQKKIAEAYDTSLTKTIVHDLSYTRHHAAGGRIGDCMLIAGGGTSSVDVYKLI